MKKRIPAISLAICVIVTMVVGCGMKNTQMPETNAGNMRQTEKETATVENIESQETSEETKRIETAPILEVPALNMELGSNDGRVYYELFVYSFYDSDGDGIGDLRGVLEKLDYLNDGDPNGGEDLGVTGIWLMPIMSSTTYHKYDTTDYYEVDPEYGSIEDFTKLCETCHERGMKVILDLAINHTSSKHPWFLEAAEYIRSLPEGKDIKEEECPYVGYYHFSKEKKSGYEALKGTEYYYEANFWSEMPDLNWDNPEVMKEYSDIAAFWLSMGADGFRLDAVKELQSGSPEKNIEILKEFQARVKAIREDAYIVCECWEQQPVYASYYESGVDSMFDFKWADKNGLIANIVNQKTDASVYALEQEEQQKLYGSFNPEYVNAPFYVNHDMGRGAGYYAGDESESKVKLAQALNLLMSGNAFLYYGEELGMKGAGKDENKRAPMYWSADPSTEGMCVGPANMDDISMKYGPYEEQRKETDSILAYVREAILLRNAYPALAMGDVAAHPELSDRDICVFEKVCENQSCLVLINVGEDSREVDLSSLDEEIRKKIYGILLTEEEMPIITENNAILPPRSIVIFGA